MARKLRPDIWGDLTVKQRLGIVLLFAALGWVFSASSGPIFWGARAVFLAVTVYLWQFHRDQRFLDPKLYSWTARLVGGLLGGVAAGLFLAAFLTATWIAQDRHQDWYIWVPPLAGVAAMVVVFSPEMWRWSSRNALPKLRGRT